MANGKGVLWIFFLLSLMVLLEDFVSPNLPVN
jgi:hypothetical protein